MGRRRARGREVNGILLLDKPLGDSSNAALQRVKRLFDARKAGHTGSLDPLATGLLPLCFGHATKLSEFLLGSDKRYWVRVKLGVTTTTADAEGEVVSERPAEHIGQADVEQVLPQFTGRIKQLPPMYSAVKHKGQRLYELAREGQEVEREPREIDIHALEVVNFEGPEFELNVHCSKGTYVRTLAEDIGEKLGVGAYVTALRRTGVGPYREADMVTMDKINELRDQVREQQSWACLDEILLPLDTALHDWPEVRLTEDLLFYLRQGQPVLVPKSPSGGQIRLYDPSGKFIGAGEIDDDGRVAPKRLLS